MRLTTKTLVVLASLVVAMSASAQPRPGGHKGGGGGGGGGGEPSGGGGAPGRLIATAEPEQLAKLISAAGFPAKVVKLKSGTLIVQIEYWPDYHSAALPVFCKDDKNCLGYQLFVNLGPDTGVDQAWMDAWNRSWSFVHAYKLDNGELIMQADVLVTPGVTPQYIQSTAQVFKIIVDKSTDFKPGE